MTITAQLGLAAELAARAEAGRPVTIGLAGAGQMGTDIVVEVSLMKGVRIGAISEVFPQNAIEAVVMAGRDRSDVVNAVTAADIDRAIEHGKSRSPRTSTPSAPRATSTSSSTRPATRMSAL